MSKKIFYQKNGVDVKLDIATLTFDNGIAANEMLKYLKFFFNTKEKFNKLFIGALKKAVKEIDPENANILQALKNWVKEFDNVSLFTFTEAFACEDAEFRAKIFGTINIPEMVANLGSTLIATATKDLVHKKYNQDGSMADTKKYQTTYETYQVSGEKLGITNKLFVVRCWCDSTGEEHYIWIEEQFASDPLTAIASTFRVPACVIPYIKEIKRQGDILLCEMSEDFASVTIKADEPMVPLTSEQYFSLLTAQS